MQKLIIMTDRNYVYDFLKFIIPKTYYFKIWVNNHKLFQNEKVLIDIFFRLSILGFLVGFLNVIENVQERSLFGFFITLMFFFAIVFMNEVYYLIKKNRKITLPDDIVIKPNVLKRRKNNPKNLELKLSKENLKIVYDYLVSIEIIKSEVTSFGVFDTVLRKDFGHDFNIVLFLNLAQIRSVFHVFEKRSKGFSSLAIRKGLFLDENLKKINSGSYRNTASKNNKKSLDKDFLHQIEKLERIIFG